MARRSRLAAIVVATLALVGAMAPPATSAVVAPQALTATSVSGWATTAVTMKLGGEVSRNVTVKPAAVRTVLVQARKGTTGTISTKATLTTSASGAVTARFLPSSTGVWYVRLSVKATSTYAASTTAWRKVTVSGTAGSTTVTMPSVSPSSVVLPATQKVSVTVKPAGARAVEVWTKAPGASTFSLRARTTSSSTGVASVTWSAPSVGSWTYKVYVRPTLTLKGVWSATRTATVTRPPGVTGLTVDVSAQATQATVSWVNPATFASVVVRRTLAVDPAPTSPSDGVNVPVVAGDPPATSVTDTGLTASTAYRWTVFAISTQGVASAGVNVTATTMSAAISWTGAQRAVPMQGSLQALSCPTSTFCLATDQYANVLVYSDGGWSAPTPVPGLAESIRGASCSTDLSCVLVTIEGRAVLRHADGTYADPVQLSDTSVPAVGCTADGSFCLAGDSSGKVYTTTDRQTWSAGSGLPEPVYVTDVDCVSKDFCAITGGVGATWTFSGLVASLPQLQRDATVTEDQVNGVDCVSASFCVYVAQFGTAWERGGPADSMGTVGEVTDVSCTSETSCTAVDYSGRVIRYDGATWATPTRPDPRAQLLAVECPSASVCVVADGSGAGWVNRWNGSTWSGVEPVDPYAGTTSVSCPTATFCTVVDQAGRATMFNGSAWSVPMKVSYPDTLTVVECASAARCFATDYSGHVFAFDGSSWTEDPISSPGERVYDIACPTATWCVLITDATRYSTWDGTSWTAMAAIDDGTAPTRIRCASASYCMAADWGTQFRIFDGANWGLWSTAPVELAAYDCGAAAWCMGVGGGTQAFVWTGTSWGESNPDVSPSPVLLSCTSSTFCESAGDSSFDTATWDGTAWSSAPVSPATVTPVQDMVCATTRFCVAIDQTGHAHIGTR